MSDTTLRSIFAVVLISIGFIIGRMNIVQPEMVVIEKEVDLPRSSVELQSIVGDQLSLQITGSVRVLWSGNAVEDDGEYTIPLPQIPHENDLPYQQFPYVGNGKTMKFYPSSTYFARGVEVRHRRFFATKEEAIRAGFAPSKAVK